MIIIDTTNSAILSSLPLSSEIYTVNDESGEDKTPLSKFAVFADLHLYKAVVDPTDPRFDPMNLGNGNGIYDFYNGLEKCKTESIDFLAVCGDVGDAPRYFENTKAIYNIVKTTANVDFPIYCVKGNHDQGLNADKWYEITENELNYVVEDDYNKFVFISLKTTSDTAFSPANQTTPYSDEAIDCLQTALSSDDGKTVHLFMHFPLNSLRPIPQYAGLGELYYPSTLLDNVDKYGFDVTDSDGIFINDQNTQILNMLKAYNGKVVVYSGHTHYIQQVEQYQANINVCQAFPNVWTVHVPSLNYPRARNRSNIATNHVTLQPSQGLIVECYEKYVVIKYIEFNDNCAVYPNQVLKAYTIPLS